MTILTGFWQSDKVDTFGQSDKFRFLTTHQCGISQLVEPCRGFLKVQPSCPPPVNGLDMLKKYNKKSIILGIALKQTTFFHEYNAEHWLSH